MRQLTSVDAQFLAMEDGRAHGHVSVLGVYDPSTSAAGVLTREAICDLIAARIDRLAPFRWRLAEVPFGIDHPYWFDDQSFDLDFHVRELALPAPGDDRTLAEQVSRIIARPLDRARPLWELYLIQGLADGRVAVLTKIHHAAVDGVSGGEIVGALLDAEPTPPNGPPPPQPEASTATMPGQLEMLARGIAGTPRQTLRALRSAPRALPHLNENPLFRGAPGAKAIAGISRRALRARPRTRDGGILEGRSLRAPRTPINAPIGPHRRVAISRQSLAEVKAIKDHYGATVNDVVVAICAGALRSWLSARGELPAEPLLAIVPVSIRTEAHRGTFGNRVSAMLTPIPTHLADPEARLLAAHEAMRSAKEQHNAIPATALQDGTEMIPPAIFARAARVSSRIAAMDPRSPPANTIISNVPGSPVPLYLAGARLEAMHPVSAVMHGVGVNLTVMSYCGGLDFGVVCDRDLVDDAWPIAAALRDAQAELVALLPVPATVS